MRHDARRADVTGEPLPPCRNVANVATPADLADVICLLEERAAIREFCGGQSRDHAEVGALADTARATGIATAALINLWPTASRGKPRP